MSDGGQGWVKSGDGAWHFILVRNPIIKGADGEPLTRKTIQYDFLHAVFGDEHAVFTSNTEKVTFGNLYRQTLIASAKMTGSQRQKMEQNSEFATIMSMVCMLVNLGRINTTLAFYPDMRTALRSYHSIPSLQRDEATRQHMYDAARMKTVLKGCVTTEPAITTTDDLLARQRPDSNLPPANPVSALFALTAQATTVTSRHFSSISGLEFQDLWVPVNVSSEDRARAFLWIVYHYLEDAQGPNPFDDPDHMKDNSLSVPNLERISKEAMELENIDSVEEVEYGNAMFDYRTQFLSKADTEFQKEQLAKGAAGALSRSQKAVKKKAAMALGRTLHGQGMDIDGSSVLGEDGSFSRASSLPPPAEKAPLPLAGATKSSSNPVDGPTPGWIKLLEKREGDAAGNINKAPPVSLFNHALNNLTQGVIDSDEEDGESYMIYVHERRLDILQTFCNFPPYRPEWDAGSRAPL